MLESLQRGARHDEWWNSKLIGDSNPLSALLRKDIKHRIVTHMCDFRAPEPEETSLRYPHRSAGTGAWDWEGFYASQNMDPHKFQYLRSLGCFSLPSSDRIGHLLDVYFSRVHPMLPIVDRGDLLSKLYGIGKPPPLVLLQAIFLAATRYAYLGDDANAAEVRADCDRRHASLRALIELDLPSDRLAVLRASLIASFHWEGREGVNSALDSLSLAVRIAQEMGLHRQQLKQGQTADKDDAMSKRLWWSLYAFDRFNAAQEGTPFLIDERDCNVEVLQESDLLDEDLITRQTTLLNQSLSGIIEDGVRSMYGPDTSGKRVNLIQTRDTLLSRLDHLEHQICETFNPSESQAVGMDSFWCAILKIHLHAVRILVLRPFLLEFDPETNCYLSRDMCRTEATAIIGELRGMKSQDLLRYSWPFTVYAVVNALLIEWYDVSSPVEAASNSVRVARARREYLEIIGLLKVMGQTWWAAAAKHKLSEALLRVADTLILRQGNIASGMVPTGGSFTDSATAYQSSELIFNNVYGDQNTLVSGIDDMAFWNSLGLDFETDVVGNIFSIY
jgi:hypothetical protein